jgi:hypothetical protein
MKKMSVIILVMAALSCVVASGHPMLSPSKVAVVKNGEVIKVIYQGNCKAPVNLTIVDADGTEVFHEKILSANGFIRPYNFSKLPKGDYQLHVVDSGGEYSEEIYFQGEWRTRHAQAKPCFGHITKLNGEGNKYLVVVPSQLQKEFAIEIYDQNEGLIFSERQRIENDFAKVYNLKNLNGATIKILAESGDEMRFKTDDQ